MKLISKGTAHSFGVFFFFFFFTSSVPQLLVPGKCTVLSFELRNENNQNMRALMYSCRTCTHGNTFLLL